jgi:hypothetical protein
MYALFPVLFFSCDKNSPPIPPSHTIFNIEVYEDVPTDHKVEMVFQEILPDTVISYPGRIERRGGYSISFPKRSYELDFDQDLPLAGLPADDDWILNANYIDKTFLRHVFSYELFRAMHPDNRAALSRYVELRKNGSYQGLYVLMEKLDKSSLGVLGKDPAAVIFKEPPLFRPDLTNFAAKAQYPDNIYQQTYPDKDQVDKAEVLDDIRDILFHTPDDSLMTVLSTIFDLRNVIDWHLLLLMSNNSDGIMKNFYLYKTDSSTPFRFAPWDYDHSFGRDGDNELNMIRPLNLEISLLFQRLLAIQTYREQLKARWLLLNEEGLFSTSGLKARLRNIIPQFEPLLADNFALWPVDASKYYDDNDFAEEVAIIEQFIELRHTQLEKYFAAF